MWRRKGSIHPLKIRMNANPGKKETRKSDMTGKTSLARGKGGIVCMVQRPFPMNAEDLLIPANLFQSSWSGLSDVLYIL